MKKIGGGFEGEGYCGSIMGTGPYMDGIAKMKQTLSQSRCHTLDRHDWAAQKDRCGTPDKQIWTEGI